eukprot:c29045_g2_i1 orf=311-3538(+)
MVFFGDRETQVCDVEDSGADEDLPVDCRQDVLETKEVVPAACGVVSSGSCQIFSQGNPKRGEVSVGRSVGGRSTRGDAAMSRSLPAATPEFGIGRSRSVSGQIPESNMTSLRSLFDLAGPATCSTNYGHGRETGGKSGILVLQVPASSLSPPLSASIVADSVQMSSTGSFFPSIVASGSTLVDTMPSVGFNKDCVGCEPAEEGSVSPSQQRERGTGIEGRETDANVNPEESTALDTHSRNRGHVEVAQRLNDVLQCGGEANLVLERGDRDTVMLQWLRALDLQVVGACRADERLRPMLRWNASCSGADGRLLAQLSQHFKARELGMLARCLCAPLVSIRVGKVQIQGRLICPSAIRGYLNLIMLPSSEMRLSFIGDDGAVERVAVVRPCSDLAPVCLMLLPPDTSGRTFVIKMPNGGHAYFWQSEKSKDVGAQLLAKLRDLLRQRPTLAQLTGIHESRLYSFMLQLRSAVSSPSSSLLSSSLSSSSGSHQSPVLSPSSSSLVITPEFSSGTHVSSVGIPTITSSRQSQRLCCNKASAARLVNSQPPTHIRPHSGNQCSLSPRVSGFKDGTVKVTTGVRCIVSSREKLRKRFETSYCTGASGLSLSCRSNNLQSDEDLDDILNTPMSTQISLSIRGDAISDVVTHSTGLYPSLQSVSCAVRQCSFTREYNIPLPKQVFNLPFVSSGTPQNLLPSIFGAVTTSPISSYSLTISEMPLSTATVLAPYYCPCPLCTAALQYTFTPPFLPLKSDTSVLPVSSSLFSVRSGPALLSQTEISLDRVSISPIPLPVSSLVNLPTPLQTSNLPLFFSDPIVHIPVIDIQSGTQSYLVTAPPSISSSVIAPMLPNFLGSIFPDTQAQMERQELPALNFLQSLGISPPWDKPESNGRNSHDKDCLIVGSKSRNLFSSTTETRLAAVLGRQTGKLDFSRGFDGQRTSEEAVMPPFNLECEEQAVGPSYDNFLQYETSPKHNGPLLGIVPAILTSGSLSRVFKFCQDRSTKSAAWVSGSRGLYGGSCEPGIPAPVTGVSSSLNAGSRERSACWALKGKALPSENLEVSRIFEDDVKPEGSHEKEFSTD